MLLSPQPGCASLDFASVSYILRVMRLRVKGDDGSFAAIIREAREDADLTQVELAQLLGVSTRTVQYWEAGQIPQAKHRRRLKAWLAEATDGEAA